MAHHHTTKEAIVYTTNGDKPRLGPSLRLVQLQDVEGAGRGRDASAPAVRGDTLARDKATGGKGSSRVDVFPSGCRCEVAAPSLVGKVPFHVVAAMAWDGMGRGGKDWGGMGHEKHGQERRTPFFPASSPQSLDHPSTPVGATHLDLQTARFPALLAKKLQQAILHHTSPGLATTTLTRLDALETPDEGTSTNRNNWENRTGSTGKLIGSRPDPDLSQIISPRHTHKRARNSSSSSRDETCATANPRTTSNQNPTTPKYLVCDCAKPVQPEPSSTQRVVFQHVALRRSRIKTNHINKRFRRSHTSFKMVVQEITSFSNMGRGAYDTTGVPKPPPRPKPR
ncbi:hypothetical protein CMUS01_00506 [Colletotrichum musicola]|uniref:Uncharacterized protein n=1 Tax=Colletotrichum musicola TaxID=2175873 RepID=A0A8H6NYR0_9PEZI|nr:hypothetical protein CMUS01_00506 [Colletotrichum musicola]